ncbi:hypothetical protein FF1_043218 [Malus domestica]
MYRNLMCQNYGRNSDVSKLCFCFRFRLPLRPVMTRGYLIPLDENPPVTPGALGFGTFVNIIPEACSLYNCLLISGLLSASAKTVVSLYMRDHCG